MRDDMHAAHDFGNIVADTLTSMGVTPPHDKEFCAVMIVIGQPPREPIGGAINYDKKAQRWEYQVQLLAPEPMS